MLKGTTSTFPLIPIHTQVEVPDYFLYEEDAQSVFIDTAYSPETPLSLILYKLHSHLGFHVTKLTPCQAYHTLLEVPSDTGVGRWSITTSYISSLFTLVEM